MRKAMAMMAAVLAGATGAWAAIPEGPPRLPEATAEATAVAQSGNGFAVDMYGQLKGRAGNLFFSPYSISMAMAMCYEGAAGGTAEEMSKTLKLPEREKLHKGLDGLFTRLQGSKEKVGFELAVANRLWPMTGFELKPEYVKTTQTTYHAGIEALNYGNSAAAAKTINDWVAKETRDRIKDLIDPGALGADTRLVLTNAIYFKGDWTTPFKEAMTQEGDFTTGEGKKVKAKLMHNTATFGYASIAAKDVPAFQALEMPYAGRDLAMLVLLPAAGELDKLEAELSAKFIEGVTGHLRQKKVQVTFPKFKMEDEFSLNKQLQAMGIKKAFTAMAEFTGISTKEGLFISDVVHKSFVEVNEKGTEAAAATGIVMKTTAMVREEPPPAFVADRPFVFVLRDTVTGAILFMGRVSDPTK